MANSPTDKSKDFIKSGMTLITQRDSDKYLKQHKQKDDASKAGQFAAWTLNNPWTLGILSWCLVFVPILGMWAIHKYGWEHWEPFDKIFKK